MSENICLTVAMGNDGKFVIVPLDRNKCHCGGKHYVAEGEINIEEKTIKIDNKYYLDFIDKHKQFFDKNQQ